MVLDSSCSNEDIRIKNKLTFCSQITPNMRKLFCNRTSNAHDSRRTKEILKASLMGFLILSIIDALIDFSKGDNTQSKAFRNKLVKYAGCCFIPLQIISNI